MAIVIHKVIHKLSTKLLTSYTQRHIFHHKSPLLYLYYICCIYVYIHFCLTLALKRAKNLVVLMQQNVVFLLLLALHTNSKVFIKMAVCLNMGVLELFINIVI